MTAAILEIRRDARPTTVRPNDATETRLRAVVPFRPTKRWRRLICRWQREADGHLACAWEPDICPGPAHLITFVVKVHKPVHWAA
jgi:hypothetical protein